MSKPGKIGAVMVVGAGIGGMQASLDLANAGYKVYLVESGPALGGVMSQLDKTFPTNDCAMCTLSPRMVECGSHLNIEKLTYTEVASIEGAPGNFKITVRKKARSVDASKCTGCGTCMSGCPVRNKIQVPIPENVTEDGGNAAADTVRGLIKDLGSDRSVLIGLLQQVNRKFNYLPEAALREISLSLEIPLAEVYGTASFFKSFSLKPRGKYIVRICMGTACHVRGGHRIFSEAERILGISEGQTSEDMMFTLERVNCLGACSLGPIVTVHEEIHARMSASGISELISGLTEKEKG